MLQHPFCDHTFSFLLSFAMQDFSLSDIFPSIRRTLSTSPNASSPLVHQPIVDQALDSVSAMLANLHFPQPLLLLLEAQELQPASEVHLSYAILRSLLLVASANQRNNILLSQMAFVSVIVPRVFSLHGAMFRLEEDPLRPTLLKLLRRTIEAGVKHAEARALFQLAIKDGSSLDDDVLEILRHGMKSRWPGMLNAWGRSWVECRALLEKGFNKNATGITFVVRSLFRTSSPLLFSSAHSDS